MRPPEPTMSPSEESAWQAGLATERLKVDPWQTGEAYTVLKGQRCPRCNGRLAVDGPLVYCLRCAYEPPESAARPWMPG